jgi:hypothetical protein
LDATKVESRDHILAESALLLIIFTAIIKFGRMQELLNVGFLASAVIALSVRIDGPG